MRRKEREVTGREGLEAILDACRCCRIGFCDAGQVYIVPVNYGWAREGEGYALYFHGARAGRKYELALPEPTVGFELDCGYQLVGEGEACAYTAAYRSIVGTGVLRLLDGREDKRRGLKLLMDHAAGPGDWQFSDEALDAAAVFRLEVTELSGKEHQPPIAAPSPDLSS